MCRMRTTQAGLSKRDRVSIQTSGLPTNPCLRAGAQSLSILRSSCISLPSFSRPLMASPVSSSVSVVHSVYNWHGGQQGFAAIPRSLSAGQRELGARPSVVTVAPKIVDNLKKSQQDAGLDVLAFPALGPAQFGFSSSGLRWAVSDAAAQHHILHQHGIWNGTSLMTAAWRWAQSKPTVVSPQGSLTRIALRFSKWKKRLVLQAYERRNLEQASCLHATSTQEAEGFRRLGLTPPIAVIPNGVAEEETQQAGDGGRFARRFCLPSQSRRMLFLSRLHPKKGIKLLLRVLARLKGSLENWHLIVAGPEDYPGYLGELRQQVADIELRHAVTFAGALHGQEKNDAFAAADLFVLPTRSDNFGIVVAESLARGVPVLTTEGAQPWECVQERVCGWWVPRRFSAMASALAQATRLPGPELSAMGARGRKLVEQRFLWRRAARMTLRLYDWLLGRAERPGFVIPRLNAPCGSNGFTDD